MESKLEDITILFPAIMIEIGNDWNCNHGSQMTSISLEITFKNAKTMQSSVQPLCITKFVYP